MYPSEHSWGAYTEYWTLILGVILILLIFFLPEGVMGFFMDRFKRGKARGTGES